MYHWFIYCITWGKCLLCWTCWLSNDSKCSTMLQLIFEIFKILWCIKRNLPLKKKKKNVKYFFVYLMGCFQAALIPTSHATGSEFKMQLWWVKVSEGFLCSFFFLFCFFLFFFFWWGVHTEQKNAIGNLATTSRVVYTPRC